MIIEVLQTPHGFHLRVKSPSKAAFDFAIEKLKEMVPKKNRTFRRSKTLGGAWTVEKEAEKQMRQWLDLMRSEKQATVNENDLEVLMRDFQAITRKLTKGEAA